MVVNYLVMNVTRLQCRRCSWVLLWLELQKIQCDVLCDSQLGLMAHTHLDSPACQGGSPSLVHYSLSCLSESICSSKPCPRYTGTSCSGTEEF